MTSLKTSTLHRVRLLRSLYLDLVHLRSIKQNLVFNSLLWICSYVEEDHHIDSQIKSSIQEEGDITVKHEPNLKS
ncbi:hypothetical protein F2Q68_00038777 [Brassica cretica]|uniref:Uncharacterized protein n=2 Tax=Brassica cretica TaxID=69181 RepID=A0ABQ7A448_BRACR|nr:hypothetical protein F2Q68_00038777 [Brassica cretica]KAF3492461.1 hypothetical protein DY000_02052344 [Brassica cretica]